MNGGYGYTLNKYDISANSRRSNLGLNFGVTVGFNLFDGNRRRERKNARMPCRTLAWNGSNWSKPCAPTSATYGRPTKTTCKC